MASSSSSSSSPSPSAALPTELNLLTLNCWGLLHISALREARLPEIGRHIAALSPAPDIVCLQECWVHDDYAAIRRATRAVLPHGKFYFSGAFGGGLAILSRWPIHDSSMFRYPLNGRPTAFFRGDWYVGKGVACASIRFGPEPQHVVDVFNTHTHAPYLKGPNNSYLCHRASQAWEISKLLRAATERGHLVVALGDFNMLPMSLAHRIITTHAPVHDVWRVLHPDSSLGPAHHPVEAARCRSVPTAAFNLAENGATSDSVYNTWRWTKNEQNLLRAGNPCPVDPEAPDPRGKRLDYIFASLGSIDSSQTGWVVKSASVALTDRHPELQVSLSDHFAVRATIRLHSLTDNQSAASGNSEGHSTDLKPEDYDTQLRDFRAATQNEHQLKREKLAMYDEVLALIHSYTAREIKQRYWRGVHFYAALVVWAACCVAVWFSPGNFVAFLLMLLSSLGLTAGVVDGLLALLFFSGELRTLKEFEWEIKNAKTIANGDLAASDEEESDGKDLQH
ncbi:Inositol phosphosphingolipids phospholipase C [Paramyrothecium foliicola]|nr:Inositol phosphosphingolipids phospholipase C [Paramyrothecium foliicola]